jgi:hypothetical protein
VSQALHRLFGRGVLCVHIILFGFFVNVYNEILEYKKRNTSCSAWLRFSQPVLEVGGLDRRFAGLQVCLDLHFCVHLLSGELLVL